MRLLAAVLLISITTPASAQELPPATRTRIDSVFSRFSNTTPGCQLGIGRDGRVLYERGYGRANLEFDVPMTATTIVEIGSVSKQFTAASILLLHQQGKLSLDDDVRKWIPELPDFGGRKVTLRQMANMTSGLRDQWGLMGLLNSPPGSAIHSNELLTQVLSRQKDLNFPPNDQYLYSNSGYMLLAEVVKRASGKSLAEFSTENIFRPLGMNSTQWRDDFTRIVKNRAFGHSWSQNDGYTTEMPFTNVYGNGGLLTTTRDIVTFWHALLNNRLGAPGFTEAMTTRATLNSGRRISYALGLTIGEYRGLAEYSHGGSTAGYRAHIATYPTERTTVAVLCNVTNAGPDALLRRVADIVLADKLAPVPARPQIKAATVPASELAAIAGLYRNRNDETVLRVELRDGQLRANGAELIPVGGNKFSRGNSEVTFAAANGGTLRYLGSDDEPIVYERASAVQPTAAELAAYAGTYVSPELDVSFTVAVENNRLVLKRRYASDVSLAPTFRDGFQGNGSYVFTRNAAGAVTGFRFTQGRVRFVEFVKQ